MFQSVLGVNEKYKSVINLQNVVNTLFNKHIVKDMQCFQSLWAILLTASLLKKNLQYLTFEAYLQKNREISKLCHT